MRSPHFPFLIAWTTTIVAVRRPLVFFVEKPELRDGALGRARPKRTIASGREYQAEDVRQAIMERAAPPYVWGGTSYPGGGSSSQPTSSFLSSGVRKLNFSWICWQIF